MALALAYLAQLQRFSSIAWGNSQALVKRLPPRNVEFIDLTDFVDAFQYFTGGIFKHGKVLIRDEYRTAMQALHTARYEHGAYVVGHPGVGKTHFLIYLLVHFLGKRQSVAMQPPSGAQAYVLFQDTATAYPLSRHDPLHRRGHFVWALCDSNEDMPKPNPVFKGCPRNIRIVQVTSPQESHYRGWSKQIGAKPYIMDIWTEEEMESLAALSGKDCERMVSLARKWGTIPQTILDCIDDEDQEIEETFLEHCSRAIRECRHIENPQLDGSGPSYFFFYRPRKRATGKIDREYHSISVPTRTLRNLLAKGLVEKHHLDRIDFYRTLSGVPGTRQAASAIYGSWFHRFFTSETYFGIQCQWVARDWDNDAFQLPPTLQGTFSLVRSTHEALRTGTPPYYWVPPRSNSLGIDGILVLEGQAFAFQVAIGSYCPSPLGGIQTLGEWSPKLKKLAWRVVFLGPEQEQIEKVARYWAGRVRFPTDETYVPVAWSVVDPVSLDLADYEPYDDASDEEMEGVIVS